MRTWDNYYLKFLKISVWACFIAEKFNADCGRWSRVRMCEPSHTNNRNENYHFNQGKDIFWQYSGQKCSNKVKTWYMCPMIGKLNGWRNGILTQWSMQCHRSKAYPSQWPSPFARTRSTQASYAATAPSQWCFLQCSSIMGFWHTGSSSSSDYKNINMMRWCSTDKK